MRLPINILAMTDPEHSYSRARIIDIVQDSVNARANPPVSFGVFQLFASRWPGVFRKRQHLLLDLFIRGGRDGIVVFLGHRQNEYPVLHLRFRRFSANACSRGIGVSPKAFASLQARISSRSSNSSRIFSYSSMLMTTATLSPRSFTTNWRSFPIASSLSAVYSGVERRAIQTNLACAKVLFVVGRRGNFEDREEGFLRDVNLADALHAAFAFFLFFEEFAFARNVAAVALGENVFSDGRDGFARDHAAADGGLNGDFEHLAGNQFAETGDEFAAAFVGHVAMSDHRQRIDGLAANEDVEFYQVGLLVAFEMVVEGGVAAGDGFEAIVKIENDFVQRQFVGEHDASRRKIFEVFLDAALVLTELQNAADGIIAGDDHGLDDGLFDHFDVAGIGEFCGAVHFDGRAADARDAITHAGRCGDEIEAEFAFEALLHDFHVQQAEKPATKTETEGHGIFRLVKKCSVVELEFAEGVAQRFIVISENREKAGKDHGFCGFKTGKRRSATAGCDDCVAHAGVCNAFDVGDDEADIAGFELF